MRAITPVFSVLLIMILSVTLLVFFWTFVTGTFNSLKLTGTSTVNESLVTISSCMKIESVSGNQVSLRNCGAGSISQSSLGAYLDDIPLNLTMNPIVIGENEVGTVTLYGLWNFNLGGHTLRMANPRVVTEAPVNAVLPDSTVLALDFDEGQGNIAYDSSAYGNKGTLNNMDNSNWVNGKYGRALTFDGVSEYIQVPNEDSLNFNSSITISLWINFISLPSPNDWDTIITKSDNPFSGTMQWELWRDPNSNPANQIVFSYNGTDNVPKNTWSNTPVYAGRWYNIVASFNGSATKIYFDGSLIRENNLVTPMTITEAPVRIGIRGDGLNPTNAIMDSVRIYNTALIPDGTISLKPVSYD
jgi:hypothetical protein